MFAQSKTTLTISKNKKQTYQNDFPVDSYLNKAMQFFYEIVKSFRIIFTIYWLNGENGTPAINMQAGLVGLFHFVCSAPFREKTPVQSGLVV